MTNGRYLHRIPTPKRSSIWGTRWETWPRRAGVRLDKLYLMHVNNQYVRHGDIDPQRILTKEGITDRATTLQNEASDPADKMLQVIGGPRPTVRIGIHCDEPYECPLKEKCWSFLPEDNVLQLYRIRREHAFEIPAQRSSPR